MIYYDGIITNSEKNKTNKKERKKCKKNTHLCQCAAFEIPPRLSVNLVPLERRYSEDGLTFAPFIIRRPGILIRSGREEKADPCGRVRRGPIRRPIVPPLRVLDLGTANECNPGVHAER